ncbi:hypothetical protein N7533_006045 [Penicillium manginii]|uniref:uncharacterized protein n=1 Tax=Penicillium manginii TaxID=203109 RepID=UPI002548B695|nr:uncharacterized protein N7533_006045 [Penicillium manginii]KAJ5756502.1 hypothetical protein N7533_006045 [Penicillium manginii]
MSNREYYGSSTPGYTFQANGSEEPQYLTNADSSSSQGEPLGAVSNHQNLPFNQQRQWGNFDSAEQGHNGASGQERGLGATVIGGAGGAFVGHKVGKKSDHGTLGTIGGALAGAVVANVASNAIKGHHGGHGSARDRRRERLERKIDRLG